VLVGGLGFFSMLVRMTTHNILYNNRDPGITCITLERGVYQVMSKPLTRIMVPVDFSTVSSPLVEYAGKLALRYGSEVILIHVIEEGIVEHVASGYNVEALVRDLEEHARSRLEELADILRSIGVNVTIYPDMPIGDPAAVVSHVAGEEGVSEILIASKGWGIKRLIPLGSTARLLVKLSPVPVIRLKAVKTDDRINLLGAVEDLFRRMLVAVKPGYGEAFKSYLLALAENVKPDITLVYIEEEESRLEEEYYRLDGEAKRLMDEVKVLEEELNALESVRLKIRAGLAARRILEKLQEALYRRSLILLENEMSRILDTFNLDPVQIEIRDERGYPAVRVITRSGMERSISMLSGGERTAIALAYVLALNKIMGSRIGFIALDEPTSELDRERRKVLMDVFSSLTEGSTRVIGQLIVITHHEEIMDRVDTVCRVEKANGVSRVKCGE